MVACMKRQRNLNLVSGSTALSEMVLPLGQISCDWQEAVTAWLMLFIVKQSMGRNGQLELPLSLSLCWLLVDCHFHSALAVKMEKSRLPMSLGEVGLTPGKS